MLDRKTPPSVREFDSLAIPSIETAKICEGVTLCSYNRPKCGILRVNVFWNAGDANLPVRGAASFVAPMLCDGTQSHTGEAIAQIFDFNGVSLRPIGNAKYTGIGILGETDKVLALLPLLSDMILTPTFPDGAFEAQHRTRLANMRTALTKPSYVASCLSAELSYGPDHPYMLPVTAEQCEAVSVADVRRCHYEGITHHSIHVFVTGDLDSVSDARSIVASFASGLKPASVESFVDIPPSPQPPQIRVEHLPHTIQSAICASIPAIGRQHPDYVDLRHAVIALGGYFGSRLMTNIRERKGLTYGIGAALIGVRKSGMVQISAQCDTEYTDTVVEEIRNELKLLASEPMCEDEMTRLRRDVMSTLATTLDTPLSIMDYYESALLADIPNGYYAAQVRSITSMTPERLCRLAACYLHPEELRIAIATI